MYYILFALILLLCLFESLFEKNKIKKIFFFITALVFIIIQCCNTWAPDLESYKIHFEFIEENYVRSLLEPVHIFLIESVKQFGGNFADFIFVYGILIMIPFLYFVYKNSPIPVFVLSVFYIIPFFPDITQIRVFLAFSVFFTSLHYFHSKKIIFYLLLGLAIICHFSLLSIIVFLILRRFAFFKDLKKSNIIILTGIAVLTLIPKSIAMSIVVLINSKYSSYLEGTETYIGTIALFLPFFLINNFVINSYNKNKKTIEEKVPVQYKKNLPLYIELIMFANYLILFQYFIRDFSRITMNLSILSFIYISILLYFGYNDKIKSQRFKSFLVRYGTYIWAFLTFYITFLMLNNGKYMEIIEKTFLSNSFYGK